MKKNFPFEFHPTIIFRSPLRPLATDADESTVLKFFEDKEASEALFLASPNLYRQYQKWREGGIQKGDKWYDKLVFALFKYYQRMHSRCTPFGLFAGVGTLSWGAQHQVALDPAQRNRQTRLDMYYLGNLAARIESIPCIREQLRYFPNSSLYHFHDEFRYVEYRYKANNNRIHQMVSVKWEDYLQEIIDQAQNGARAEELARLLVDEDITLAEALQYIGQLIEAQLLVSELELSVTGTPYFHRLIDILRRMQGEEEVDEIVHILEQVDNHLQDLDRRIGNERAKYEQITALLEKLEVNIDESKIFQVDLSHHSTEGQIPWKLQREMAAALDLLKRLNRPRKNKKLEEFKKAFSQRYEDKEIPLLQALDRENGIGYGSDPIEDDNPLTEDIPLSAPGEYREGYHDTPVEKWKRKRLGEALEKGDYEVPIHREDLAAFGPRRGPDGGFASFAVRHFPAGRGGEDIPGKCRQCQRQLPPGPFCPCRSGSRPGGPIYHCPRASR